MRFRRALAAALAAAAAAAGPAFAADKLLGRFERWEAHRSGTGKDMVCFVAALPAKSEGKIKRGEAVLMIAHFPQRKAFGQVQVKGGFALRTGATVELAVGKRVFRLTAEGDSAFGGGTQENGEIIAALKGGQTAVATGLAAAGPKIVDTYTLGGFTKALALIDKACGRK